MWDKMLVMAALRLKICALQKVKRVSTDNEIIREKITSIIYEFLLLVDQTKEELKMNGWIHMPEYSEENVYYKLLRGKYEAFIYNNLGALSPWQFSEFFFTRAIYSLLGFTRQAKHIDDKIVMFNAKKQATNDPNAAASFVLLQSTKNMYEDMLRANGISSEETIPLVVLKLGDSS